MQQYLKRNIVKRIQHRYTNWFSWRLFLLFLFFWAIKRKENNITKVKSLVP